MSETTDDFHTPLPGKEVFGEEVNLLRKAFLAKFRVFGAGKVPNNLPTACVLNGRRFPNYLNSPYFLTRKSVFFYLDGQSSLWETTPAQVLHYLSIREPWEDYDICLFDDTLEWCVGITHNNYVIVVVN